MPHSVSNDVLQLFFENLVGDSESLARAGLVCRLWRALSLPFLLREVDLSSHNNGRLPEHEDSHFPFTFGVVMSDYSDEYRPQNLVPRQRAFLRLMIDRPELAIHVKVFTWTLVWMDFDEDGLTDTDMQTWTVFGRMQNVTRLDLASIHDISDQPYIRQNPARLFPAVTHLRLVGWMHRGLVRSILTSLDVGRLISLELDHLQDEGALPNGKPIPQDLATEHRHRHEDPYVCGGINDELWERQEKGEAAIFPGPMWFPLRLLRQSCLSSMAHLQIRLGHFSEGIDQRNYTAMFQETANFIQSTKDTLKAVSIGLGEDPVLSADDAALRGICATSRIRIRSIYGPLCFDLTSAFLHALLQALAEGPFPQLTEVHLEGFRIIHSHSSRLTGRPDPNLTWQYIRACPLVDEEFTKVANLDYREPFLGYDYYLPSNMEQDKLHELEQALQGS